MQYRTAILPPDAASLALAAEALLAGELVGMPTETVYGLAAVGADAEAVRRIFLAKGRPADNPLILHIARREQALPLVRVFSKKAEALAEAFWPGPLTLVMPVSAAVPAVVTAGLDTVALRMPSHALARTLIERTAPLAAPSANRSGRPSPTTAAHVLEDMEGKIPYILDGGPCAVGLESTVLDVSGDIPRLLRPGDVTLRALEAVIGEIAVDEAIFGALAEGKKPASPGMKYRHYAPRADLALYEETIFFEEAVKAYDEAVSRGKRCAILCFSGEEERFAPRRTLALGKRGDIADLQRRLFGVLHALDQQGMEAAFAPALPLRGETLAYMNRLQKAGRTE